VYVSCCQVLRLRETMASFPLCAVCGQRVRPWPEQLCHTVTEATRDSESLGVLLEPKSAVLVVHRQCLNKVKCAKWRREKKQVQQVRTQTNTAELDDSRCTIILTCYHLNSGLVYIGLWSVQEKEVVIPGVVEESLSACTSSSNSTWSSCSGSARVTSCR